MHLSIDGLIEWHSQLLIKPFPSRLVLVENFASEFSDGFCVFARYHDYTVAIGNNHVAWTNQHAANRDRFVDGFDLIATGSYASTAVHVIEIYRNLLLNEFVGIAYATIGDNATGALAYPKKAVE